MSLLITALLLIQGQPAAVTPAQDELNRIICRRKPVTGSRTDFEQECRTRREWNERRRNIARGMREHLDRAYTGQPPPEVNSGK